MANRRDADATARLDALCKLLDDAWNSRDKRLYRIVSIYALRAAGLVGRPSLQFSIRINTTLDALREGKLDAANRRIRRAAGMLDEPAVSRSLPAYWSALASLRSEEGDLLGARESYEKGARIARQQGNLVSAVRAMFNLAALRADEGDFLEALSAFREAGELNSLIGDVQLAAGIHQNIGFCLRRLGQLEASEAEFKRAYKSHLESGNDPAAANCLNSLGTVCVDRGDSRGAIRNFCESARLFHSAGSRYGAIAPFANLVCELAEMQLFGVANYLLSAVDQMVQSGVPVPDLCAYFRARATFEENLGKVNEALYWVDRALVSATEGELRLYRALALTQRAKIRLALGQVEAAFNDALESQVDLAACGSSAAPAFVLNTDVLLEALRLQGKSDVAAFIAKDAREALHRIESGEYRNERLVGATQRIRRCLGKDAV
ncbi:MAG: hypothetical protein ICCCNLDF_01348 [Planctomycetes bacterium]|nr:hypothetical protein [Planctomycetota bacterium]